MKRSRVSPLVLLLAVLLLVTTVVAQCPYGTFLDGSGNCRTRNGGYVYGSRNGVWQPIGIGSGTNQNGLQGGGGLNGPGRFFNNKPHKGLMPWRYHRGPLPRLHIDWNMAHYIRITHGVMATLAFVIFFPFGAILVRMLPGPLAVAAHAGLQIMGFILYIIAFGLGLWMATRIRWSFFDFYQNYHPILGILIFVILFFQPLLGAMHHIGFRNKGRRGLASYIHIWVGRLLIILGMINGGLGLYISGNVSDGQIWAYALLAGIIFIIWMICAAVGELRRVRRDVPVRRRDDHHLGRRRDRDRSITPPLDAHTALPREK